jgi:hypothetical protein
MYEPNYVFVLGSLRTFKKPTNSRTITNIQNPTTTSTKLRDHIIEMIARIAIEMIAMMFYSCDDDNHCYQAPIA